MVFGGMGFLFGSGGSALISKTLGERRQHRANRIFSYLVSLSLLVGVLLALFCFIFLRPVAVGFGAEGELLENSLRYGRIYLLGIPASIIQFEFQNLYVTANKPKLGLYSTLASGVANIILDALFIVLFGWGLEGAAIATIGSQWLAALFPLIYFSRGNTSLLRFVRTRIDWRAMGKVVTNGASELLNNVSMSTVGVIYNGQLLRYAGNDGLAAYGILMYVSFLFVSIYIGYAVGISPVISFHFGARNPGEIKSLLLKSYGLLSCCGGAMFLFSECSAGTVAGLFVGYDPKLLAIAKRGFFLYAFSFLFSGIAIFGSAFFTALNNGSVSAFISFMRTIVLEIALVLILPRFIGLDGIWLSVVFAEFFAALLGLVLVFIHRKRCLSA